MNNIEKKVIELLMSGRVFSDGAIIKNLGITEIELENIYNSLTEQGYLESYSDFLKRNPEKSCSSNCSSNCCSSKNDNVDLSLIRVLTEKAYIFEDFSEENS